jgi:hypothetical protein
MEEEAPNEAATIVDQAGSVKIRRKRRGSPPVEPRFRAETRTPRRQVAIFGRIEGVGSGRR